MNRAINLLICLLLTANLAYANQTTLLREPIVAALSQELSGETAKSNLEYIARYHRMRGSRGFRAAAEHIVRQLRDYGIADARIEQFPADGKIFMEHNGLALRGTLNSRNCGSCAKRMRAGHNTHGWRVGKQFRWRWRRIARAAR